MYEVLLFKSERHLCKGSIALTNVISLIHHQQVSKCSDLKLCE